MKQRYLRWLSDTRPVIPVSDLILWTKILSARTDMVELWGPPPAEANLLGGVANPDGVRSLLAIEKSNATPPALKLASLGHQYRIAWIVAAIAVMPLEEYTLPDQRIPGKPRMDKLRSFLGFDISAVERDSAFEMFMEAKEARKERSNKD